MNPKDHPNAAMALISGYVATALVFAAKKLGVHLSPEESSTIAVGIIGLVLAVGRASQAHSASPPPPPPPAA